MTRKEKAKAVYSALTWQPRYAGSFADYDDMINSFGNPDNKPAPEEVIYAAYECEAYEGSAIVIYSHDGKLFEVNASHCSCYGLEDGWSPEETSWPAIAMRHGSYKRYKGLREAIDAHV